MSLTITTIKKNVVGNQYERTVDITFANHYLTGGVAFTPSLIEPTAASSGMFHSVNIDMNDATVADHRIVSYDATNQKLIVETASGTEATNDSDQSAVTVRAVVRYGGVTG